MGNSFLFTIITIMILIRISMQNENNECPKKCDCLEQYVDCSKKNLVSVPRIPKWVEQLDLSYNKLSKGITEGFEELLSLKILKLDKNTLLHIPTFLHPNQIQESGYNQPAYGGQAGQLEIGHGPYPSIGAGGTVSPQVQQWFRAVDKDQSGFITAIELKSALVNAQGQTFSETACNLMIGMFDKDRSGHINLEEFDKLYTYINQWLAVFKTYDTDQSGHIDGPELSKALMQMGFRFTPEFINFLIKRSDPNEGKISVDNFIVLCVQVQRFTEAFRVRDTQQNGTVTIGFEDFLNIALSCSI
nr:sorcin isoform X2 [Vanessa tameamea]